MSIALTRGLPFSDAVLKLDGNEVPLRVPPETTDSQLNLTPHKPLGFATAEGGLVAISWDGELETLADGKAVAAQLQIGDLDGPGDYKGKINLLGTDEKGIVEVSVSATDFIAWPILALLLGIGLAFFVKRWTNVRRVGAELDESLASIVADFARPNFSSRSRPALVRRAPTPSRRTSMRRQRRSPNDSDRLPADSTSPSTRLNTMRSLPPPES